ncbi:MAG TPA: hypothetical protein VIM65_14335 [Cyclobacteriaceae bacterium]
MFKKQFCQEESVAMNEIMASLEIIFKTLQEDDHVDMSVINSNFLLITELIAKTNFDKIQAVRISSAFQLLDDIDLRFRRMSLTHRQVSVTRGLLLKTVQLHLA